jgi:hypothetical protein
MYQPGLLNLYLLSNMFLMTQCCVACGDNILNGKMSLCLPKSRLNAEAMLKTYELLTYGDVLIHFVRMC